MNAPAMRTVCQLTGDRAPADTTTSQFFEALKQANTNLATLAELRATIAAQATEIEEWKERAERAETRVQELGGDL